MQLKVFEQLMQQKRKKENQSTSTMTKHIDEQDRFEGWMKKKNEWAK